jgi:hypothetical protein
VTCRHKSVRRVRHAECNHQHDKVLTTINANARLTNRRQHQLTDVCTYYNKNSQQSVSCHGTNVRWGMGSGGDRHWSVTPCILMYRLKAFHPSSARASFALPLPPSPFLNPTLMSLWANLEGILGPPWELLRPSLGILGTS